MKQEKEHIEGTIERITYHSEETSFCVLKAKVKGKKDLLAIIGNVPSISVGEYVKCSGIWHNNPTHGLQFKADFIRAFRPNTLEGMEKYLGSGLVRGIGPYFAKKLINKFKERTFDVIENTPELLITIEGIGKKKTESISKSWKEQKVVREIMVFLQSHGIGTARATRIYKTYGDDAINIVSDNPYRLAKDIRGIGFLSADKIAQNLGIDKNSLIRARSAINHILFEAASNGHCGLPVNTLMENTKKLLDIEENIILLAIDEEIKSGDLTEDTIEDKKIIFLASYYFYEKNIANLLITLMKNPLRFDINEVKALDWTQKKLEVALSESQKVAFQKALNTKVVVITGGPGTGKTTLVKSILTILEAKKIKIKLSAPTGRAAKRLSETTGLKASTIHRLLEFDPMTGGFKHNEYNKLNVDYLVIDEMSMVDVPLFNSVLKALPIETYLLIVGDVDQLPSVGAGSVLKNIIDSNVISTVKLTEIFRQAKTSDIIINAHRINEGKFPNLKNKDNRDFFFIESNENENTIKTIVNLVKTRLPSKFKLNPTEDIRTYALTN
jgi:exodeoxyribonuclease V alpha subunit